MRGNLCADTPPPRLRLGHQCETEVIPETTTTVAATTVAMDGHEYPEIFFYMNGTYNQVIMGTFPPTPP